MAHEIVMPQLGLSMDSGRIIQWVKKSGDMVQPGEVLLEVESDKSVVEIEAVTNGKLQILLGPEAGEINVGQVIGYILEDDEAIPEGMPDRPDITLAELNKKNHTDNKLGTQPSNMREAGDRRPPSTPAARRKAAELGVNWQQATPSGKEGQILERDVLALAERLSKEKLTSASPQIKITPVARRLAETAGIDLEALAQIYPGKKLERDDVEKVLRQATTEKASVTSTQPTIVPGGTSIAWPLDEIHKELPAHREGLSGLRRAVAERMSSSTHINAQVTLTTKADATELVKIRTFLMKDTQNEPVPSYNVLLAVLTARALCKHPELNAVLDGEQIIYWDTVNLGIAVDSPRGLVVPVLRNVEAKSLFEISREAQDLLARAADGKALPDELSGGTFTLTNLGPQEIDFFTPIINPPQCAVLGVGCLKKEVVVIDDQPAVRTMLPLSLTFDHRLVDGAPAARFLQRIKQYVQWPYLWLR
jgi:pyruvate dehydrogenase E2 component (dihydrolipoamide acetyltransferase)